VHPVNQICGLPFLYSADSATAAVLVVVALISNDLPDYEEDLVSNKGGKEDRWSVGILTDAFPYFTLSLVMSNFCQTFFLPSFYLPVYSSFTLLSFLLPLCLRIIFFSCVLTERDSTFDFSACLEFPKESWFAEQESWIIIIMQQHLHDHDWSSINGKRWKWTFSI